MLANNSAGRVSMAPIGVRLEVRPAVMGRAAIVVGPAHTAAEPFEAEPSSVVGPSFAAERPS